MADPSIINNAFEHYPIMQSSKRYACYLYALIARWVHDTPNFHLSYYDALCSPAACQLLSAAMLKVPKSQNFMNLINLFTEHLCDFSGEKFISTFAPDLFAGDPKAVFDYLLSTQPDNTLFSEILSALKLQAVLITKQILFHNSYPALHKKLRLLKQKTSVQTSFGAPNMPFQIMRMKNSLIVMNWSCCANRSLCTRRFLYAIKFCSIPSSRERIMGWH